MNYFVNKECEKTNSWLEDKETKKKYKIYKWRNQECISMEEAFGVISGLGVVFLTQLKIENFNIIRN